MASAPEPKTTLARYLAGPALLERTLDGLSDADLDTAPAEGGWTIRQIVHHIADGDDIWKACIKIALGGERGEFSLVWYRALEQTDWAERWSYAGRPLDGSLELLRVIRTHIAQLLERSPDGWNSESQFVNPDGSREAVSVGFVVAMQADHLEHHVRRIEEIRRQIVRD